MKMSTVAPVLLLYLVVGSVSAQSLMTLFHLTDLHFDPLAEPTKYNASTFCRGSSASGADEDALQRGHSAFEAGMREKLRRAVAVDARLSQLAAQFDDENDLGVAMGGKFGRFGCDSPEHLVDSCFKAMAAAASADGEAASFVVVSGDWGAHHLENFDLKLQAMQRAVQKLTSAFPPTTLVIPAIGNNDVFPDYNATCDHSMYSALLDNSLWGQWIPQSQQAAFKHMGSFTLSPSTEPNLLFVSLNTVLYASRNAHSVSMGSDPCGQFAWFENILIKASQQGVSVILVGHVVPGVDAFGNGNDYFALNFTQQFSTLVNRYAGTIGAQLFGHTHSDEFRLMWLSPSSPGTRRKRDDPPTQSLLIAPAVTPIFGNNPGFRLVSVERTHYSVANYSQYFLNLMMANAAAGKFGSDDAQWNSLYDWQSQYGMVGGNNPTISTEALARIVSAFPLDPQLLDAWMARRELGVMPDELVLLCSIGSQSQADFASCFARLNSYAGRPPI